VYPRIQFAEPAISFALQPKAKGDEDKISNALARLAEEDPTLRYHYDPETKQLLISGVGQLHIEVTLERMKRKFNAEVVLLPPRIPYKETVKGRAQVQGRHKKQTGGRGQFGDCWIEIEPLPRGSGLEFVDKIFGGSIPRNFIPSVEKGVRARLDRGVVAGYQVVDVRVTLYDGSYHSVDSSDIAFQLAGQIAAEKAVLEARPCLLEPVMDVEVTAPSGIAGDVIGDLNSRRGRIAGMEPGDESTVVRAQVPMAEMLNYEPHLRSMSGGRGSYSMEFSHYEELPGMLADKIVAEAKKEKEARAAEKH
jgi:elongation factor G